MRDHAALGCAPSPQENTRSVADRETTAESFGKDEARKGISSPKILSHVPDAILTISQPSSLTV